MPPTRPQRSCFALSRSTSRAATTHEYGYLLTDGSGASEIVAINDHEFLVDERDGKGLGDGSAAKVKKLYKIDLTGATDITNLSGAGGG